MTLSTMLAISAVMLLFTLVVIFLAMLKTGGDQKKLEAVPIRTPLILVGSLCVAAIGTQAVLSNLAAVSELQDRRAYAAFAEIEAQASLEMGKGGPFMDVSAGSNGWRNDELAAALGSGEEVSLKTDSGTKASLRLRDIDGTSFHVVLAYDGVEIPVPVSAMVEIKNTKGFPQLMNGRQLPPM